MIVAYLQSFGLHGVPISDRHQLEPIVVDPST